VGKSDGGAEFLPDIQELGLFGGQDHLQSTKVNSVFDQAAERRKGVRRRGGESVAALASKIDSANVLKPYKKLKAPPKAQTSTQVVQGVYDHSAKPVTEDDAHPNFHRRHSRSESISSDIRPGSRKGNSFAPVKRSSLSRISSFNNEDPVCSAEERNKAAISRVVMVGMRLHGYEQTTKSAASVNGLKSPTADSTEPHLDNIQDEKARGEYKLVYHQAYRATICTFRRHMQNEDLHLHKVTSIQETVDKLLAILCTDPLSTG
jgi:hypothetical protein